MDPVDSFSFCAILRTLITFLDQGRFRKKIVYVSLYPYPSRSNCQKMREVPYGAGMQAELDYLHAAHSNPLYCLRVTVYYSQLESGGKRTDSLWFTGPVKRKFKFCLVVRRLVSVPVRAKKGRVTQSVSKAQ